MSKRIRRARSKSSHTDPFGLIPAYLMKAIKRLNKRQQEEVIATSAMPCFVRRHFNKEVWAHKADVIKFDSPRRVVVGGRRCGKTEFVALDALYNALARPRQKVIITGPSKSHIQEIFDRMRELLYTERDLEIMRHRDVSAPWFEMGLNNGSRLRGFSLGTRRNDGVALRGQDADHIYVDEFSETHKDGNIEDLLPMLQTRPETKLTMVGSPSRNDSWIPEDLDIFDRFSWHTGDTPQGELIEQERAHFTPDTWARDIAGEWSGYERS